MIFARYVILSILCLLALGCQRESQIERDLQKKILFDVRQVLLRDLIHFLDDEVETEIRLEPRLREVADLSLNHLPHREEDSFIPLGVCLDIISMQCCEVYQVYVAWKVEGDVIFVYFAGDDEEFEKLQKRDYPD